MHGNSNIPTSGPESQELAESAQPAYNPYGERCLTMANFPVPGWKQVRNVGIKGTRDDEKWLKTRYRDLIVALLRCLFSGCPRGIFPSQEHARLSKDGHSAPHRSTTVNTARTPGCGPRTRTILNILHIPRDERASVLATFINDRMAGRGGHSAQSYPTLR